MKKRFKTGDKKIYKKEIVTSDQAIFHGELLHQVCSTFALARDFEWTSRLFFLEMKEEDEEGERDGAQGPGAIALDHPPVEARVARPVVREEHCEGDRDREPEKQVGWKALRPGGPEREPLSLLGVVGHREAGDGRS